MSLRVRKPVKKPQSANKSEEVVQENTKRRKKLDTTESSGADKAP